MLLLIKQTCFLKQQMDNTPINNRKENCLPIWFQLVLECHTHRQIERCPNKYTVEMGEQASGQPATEPTSHFRFNKMMARLKLQN